MTRRSGLGTILLLTGATLAVAAERNAPAKTSSESDFTLGLVQKEVRLGMSGADLVSALGSPNILTRDARGRETWVYDRFATEIRVKSSGLGGGGGGMGSAGSSLLLGLLNGHLADEKSVTSQRTLTVVIRFDLEGRVESFAFHSSRF